MFTNQAEQVRLTDIQTRSRPGLVPFILQQGPHHKCPLEFISLLPQSVGQSQPPGAALFKMGIERNHAFDPSLELTYIARPVQPVQVASHPLEIGFILQRKTYVPKNMPCQQRDILHSLPERRHMNMQIL